MFRSKYLSKRVRIIYVVILLWVLFGSLAAWKGVIWSELSWYFASLTTYVGAYIASETFKKSKRPTSKLPKSNRERITYTCMFIWAITGVYGVWTKTDLTQLAAYFTALSGFIAIYVLGQYFRAVNEDNATVPTIKKSSSKQNEVKKEEKKEEVKKDETIVSPENMTTDGDASSEEPK
jgi:cation transport ATPase